MDELGLRSKYVSNVQIEFGARVTLGEDYTRVNILTLDMCLFILRRLEIL